MRVKRVKRKIKQRVSIPKDLGEFLKHVYELILKKDESTTIPSDDLIQDDFIYGGLIEEGGVEYGFTYFPGEGTRNKWELIFTVGQLEDVREGRLKYLDLWGCKSKKCQCKFHSKDETCFYCDYVEREGVKKD